MKADTIIRYRRRLGIACLFAFSHCTSPTDVELGAPSALPKGMNTAMGRIYNPRTGGCSGFLVCEDVVVTQGRCVSSPTFDPKKLRFDRAPEGRYPVSTGIRVEYYLGRDTSKDIAVVKLDKSYSDFKGSWETSIPNDGVVARDWVKEQMKRLCGAPTKNFYVRVYPGGPGEVTANFRNRADVPIIECPQNNKFSPGCATKLIPGDVVTLRAKQLWNKFSFKEWRSLAETVCPCGGGQRTSPECQFGASEVEARNLGCVGVYDGPGIAPLVRILNIPTVAELEGERKTMDAGGSIPGLNRFLDPTRFMTMPEQK